MPLLEMRQTALGLWKILFIPQRGDGRKLVWMYQNHPLVWGYQLQCPWFKEAGNTAEREMERKQASHKNPNPLGKKQTKKISMGHSSIYSGQEYTC